VSTRDANVINIVAPTDTARGAAAIANGVAATFLARERRQQAAAAEADARCAEKGNRRSPGVEHTAERDRTSRRRSRPSVSS
jgi:hypothetical protein